MTEPAPEVSPVIEPGGPEDPTVFPSVPSPIEPSTEDPVDPPTEPAKR